ncbi:FecR family protein [uncultured Winogradskyella sp.]|uniref:FecR family protein n=1 Tax=uncultured Winogradskyella sp. TaxID=395353 RepID=UPI00260FA7AE|nr:FecR family protein [uncultured Winogradskyella sp.]|tara:strand:+ start:13100 stop:14008 length:909 start_codon:yes stop_codon:yes gene_type:complete
MTEDDLLKKWLNNELTDAEKKAFSERNDYGINQEIINKAQYFKASNFSKVDTFKTFKDAYENKPKANRLNWLKPLLRIASVFLIGFGLYFTVFNSDVVEIQTLASQHSTTNLPDLSLVLVNAESELSYNKDNWESKRSVNLEGEAYFKVAKGKTFDVITDNGIVTVVGTEFNVKTRLNYFEVKCYEGVVKVVSDTIVRQLKVGETFRILNNTFTEYKTTDTEPQWTNDRSSFKGIPLTEVFEELERQYNVDVTFKNTNKTRLFTGSFVHKNLKNALISITKPMGLMFEISSSNQVLIYDKTN